MISAIVLTKNEEKNIEGLIKNLFWCEEIIVIDDYSEDNTTKIAQCLGAKVYKRHLKHNFASQRNFGLKKANGDWAFFIDGDERVSPELRQEIKENCFKKQDYTGFYLKRRDFFLGRWLKHGETNSVRLLRLAKKASGKWQGKVHEVWLIKGKVKTLKNPLFHKRDITISQFLSRINRYSSLRAKELYNQNQKANIFLILAFPLGKFLQNYILRLGFLDGLRGVMMALMMAIHSLLMRVKLYFLWQKDIN